jgi:hypothetical protein
MSLIFLDENLETLTSLTTSHNSFTGEEDVKLIYIRNNDPQFYYTGITVVPSMIDLEEGALFSESGWSIKLSFGSEQPTEEEWGDILPNTPVSVPNIGNSSVGNIESIFPIWVRIFCPGHSKPQIKKDLSLKIRFTEKLVN